MLAFEPDPRNYSLLVKNVGISGYKNVTTIQKAISLNSGSSQLHLKTPSTESSIVELDGTDQKTTVETVTLDDVCESMLVEPENISLIKMDVEGAEMMALLGMQQLIKQSKNLTIISELIPELMSGSSFSPQDYISKLRENQFSIGVIAGKTSDHSSQVEIIPIENVIETVYTGGAYLVCCKR